MPCTHQETMSCSIRRVFFHFHWNGSESCFTPQVPICWAPFVTWPNQTQKRSKKNFEINMSVQDRQDIYYRQWCANDAPKCKKQSKKHRIYVIYLLNVIYVKKIQSMNVKKCEKWFTMYHLVTSGWSCWIFVFWNRILMVVIHDIKTTQMLIEGFRSKSVCIWFGALWRRLVMITLACENVTGSHTNAKSNKTACHIKIP